MDIAVKQRRRAPVLARDTTMALSQSPLWSLQRRYFQDQGISAWRQNTVPSYVTTNPFCARSYADMLCDIFAAGKAAEQDRLRQEAPRQEAPGQEMPVDVVELGAGSGRFAYALLTRLFDRQANSGTNTADGPPAATPPFRYVMTDVSDANIAFWREHPDFARFVAAGQLDFARFDVETDTELTLAVSGRRITPARPAGALAVIANYVFDGTSQDAFAIRDGHLHELRVMEEARATESGRVRAATTMQGGARGGRTGWPNLRYQQAVCTPDHYPDKVWNALLARYQAQLPSGAFLMPTGALSCIARFRRLTSGALVALTCDRGRTWIGDFDGEAAPQPLQHGSFSFEVNYDMLAEWTRAAGGRAHLPQAHASIAVAALAFGLDATQRDRLADSYDRHVLAFGPDDFFMLKQAFDRDWQGMSLKQLIAFLRLSAWDPAILSICYDGVVTQLSDANREQRRHLAEGVTTMWRHYLHLGEDLDIAFLAGSLIAGLGDFSRAIPFFELSLKRHGDDPATRQNLEHCRRKTADL